MATTAELTAKALQLDLEVREAHQRYESLHLDADYFELMSCLRRRELIFRHLDDLEGNETVRHGGDMSDLDHLTAAEFAAYGKAADQCARAIKIAVDAADALVAIAGNVDVKVLTTKITFAATIVETVNARAHLETVRRRV